MVFIIKPTQTEIKTEIIKEIPCSKPEPVVYVNLKKDPNKKVLVPTKYVQNSIYKDVIDIGRLSESTQI
jgi:hypothetical protein